MAPFLRIAFNSYDLGILPPLTDPPFCAIKMKEALTTGEIIFLSFAEVSTSAQTTNTNYVILFCLNWKHAKNIFSTSSICPSASQKEGRPWFSVNPPCTQPGSPLLMHTSMKVVCSRYCWWRQRRSHWLKCLSVCLSLLSAARKPTGVLNSG